MRVGIEALHRICCDYAVKLESPRDTEGISFINENAASKVDFSKLDSLDIFNRKSLSESKHSTFLVVPREPQNIFVAADIEDLITNGLNDCALPNCFYLVSDKFGGLDGEFFGDSPARFDELKLCGELMERLKHFADNRDTSGSLVFLRLRKLLIRPQFSFADFNSVCRVSPSLRRLVQMISCEEFTETKQDIFRSCLIEEFASNGMGPVISFGTILTRVASLENRYETDLQIYIREHGFERLRDSAVERKIGLGAKIESLIVSVEAFSLTIPPAIYVVAEKADSSKGFGKLLDFSTNTLLLVSSVLFFGLMVVAHFRHLRLIEDIGEDIETVRSDFVERSGESFQDSIKNIFAPLERRLDWAKCLSWARAALGALPMIIILCKID